MAAPLTASGWPDLEVLAGREVPPWCLRHRERKPSSRERPDHAVAPCCSLRAEILPSRQLLSRSPSFEALVTGRRQGEGGQPTRGGASVGTGNPTEKLPSARGGKAHPGSLWVIVRGRNSHRHESVRRFAENDLHQCDMIYINATSMRDRSG